MSLLSELKNILEALSIPVETGVFTSKAPEQYVVLVPLRENFELFSDNIPEQEIQEVRITLYSKENYLKTARNITKQILANDFTITERRHGGYEKETGYHQYTIDVAQNYEFKEE